MRKYQIATNEIRESRYYFIQFFLNPLTSIHRTRKLSFRGTLACGVAEPCSRLRRFGGALSERSEFAPSPESANRAGNPKGHDRANMVLGPFAETKGPRLPGRNPASRKNLVGKKKMFQRPTFTQKTFHVILNFSSQYFFSLTKFFQ